MEIQHLVYCGQREQGNLRVNRVDVLSPWRRIDYYKGLRFQVGKAIPADIANIIAKDYPGLFKMETKQIDDKEAYFLQISDALEECLAVLGDDETLKVIDRLVEKYFEGYNLKKSAPKKKPRRRTK